MERFLAVEEELEWGKEEPGFEARDAGEKTVTDLVAVSMKGDGIRRTGRPVGWFK